VSRKSRRAEAALEKASSPAETFIHTAADRVGPLAQSAADKLGPLAEAAADALGAAADRVSPFAHSAANRVGPLAQSAVDRVGPLAQTAAGRIAPLAGQAVDRVSPYTRVAAERITPLAQNAAGYAQTAAGYAQTAADRFTPIATSALLRGNQVTQEAVRRITPVFDEAVVRVTPAVEAARGRVTVDLLPRLSGALSAATGTLVPAPAPPVTTELALPDKKPRGRWVRRIAIVGALGAVAVVVVRRFVGGQDADWQAARPSTPYVPPSTTPTPQSAGAGSSSVLDHSAPDAGAGPVTVEEDFAATEPVAATEEVTSPPAAPVKMINVNDAGDVEETVVDEVVFREPVADLPETRPVDDLPRSGKAARWSGEGVYVGSEPPEGFVIKGNNRSMKYHMPEAAGYSRTVAEVWFNSEEAAQRAGFVRAQR
jgi:hypothetical protein